MKLFIELFEYYNEKMEENIVGFFIAWFGR